MAANSKNQNGSDWVTARHGGDGKGNTGSGPAPNPVNHHGAVNAKKSASHTNDTDKEDQTDSGSDENQENEQDNGGHHSIPAYTQSIADKLRKEHGLTHTHSVRIAAGITKKHADGHASVDSKTQMAAKVAHDELQGALKKHGSATKAAVGGSK